jgi:threonine synthase
MTGADVVSLGEGNTPLVWTEAFGRQVAFKCEYQNPTGSFKDRGTTALVTFLKSRGVTEAVEDSSGNAGASFAAYAARAGIRARVFVPESASGPKRRQIEMYGAELVPVAGPRSNAAEAVKRAVAESETGFLAYASHAYLPFNLPGYATIAREIVEQAGRVPGAVIVPAGQGGLLLGAWRGFVALNPPNVTRESPRMVGVQAAACSPLASQKSKVEGQTLAEGVRVSNPLRKNAVRKAVEESGGWWATVEEKEILPGRDALARRGFYVEPTSALVWKALEESLPRLPDPVVVILTGSGLKFFE